MPGLDRLHDLRWYLQRRIDFSVERFRSGALANLQHFPSLDLRGWERWVVGSAAVGSEKAESSKASLSGTASNLRISWLFRRREADPLPGYVGEADKTFTIVWTGTYRIACQAFVYSERNSGRVRTMLGCPTRHIVEPTES
jgi:hypothetical protein